MPPSAQGNIPPPLAEGPHATTNTRTNRTTRTRPHRHRNNGPHPHRHDDPLTTSLRGQRRTPTTHPWIPPTTTHPPTRHRVRSRTMPMGLGTSTSLRSPMPATSQPTPRLRRSLAPRSRTRHRRALMGRHNAHRSRTPSPSDRRQSQPTRASTSARGSTARLSASGCRRTRSTRRARQSHFTEEVGEARRDTNDTQRRRRGTLHHHRLHARSRSTSMWRRHTVDRVEHHDLRFTARVLSYA